MKSILAALVLTLSFGAHAKYSLAVPEIRLQYKTADGAPVAGVGLAYNLTAEVLRVTDGSSFITVPALPNWHRTAVGIELLGETNLEGRLLVPPTKYGSLSPLKRAAECNIFSNGVIFVCETQAISLPMDAPCGQLLTKSSAAPIELNCSTTWTAAEVEQKMQEAQAACQSRP